MLLGGRTGPSPLWMHLDALAVKWHIGRAVGRKALVASLDKMGKGIRFEANPGLVPLPTGSKNPTNPEGLMGLKSCRHGRIARPPHHRDLA